MISIRSVAIASVGVCHHDSTTGLLPSEKDEQLQCDEQFLLGDTAGRGESDEVHTIR